VQERRYVRIGEKRRAVSVLFKGFLYPARHFTYSIDAPSNALPVSR